MSQLPVNDLTVHYEQSGTGTPVLLIHGHPFDCTMWRPQLAAGLPGHLIAPDLRNFGRTKSPNGPTSWSTYAEDLLAFADTLGIQRFAAAGLSMGGQIALELAALAPDRLLGLALCDTSAPLDTPEKRANRLALADRLEREGMEPYAEEVLPKMVCDHTLDTKPEIAREVEEMMKRSPVRGAADAARARTQRRDYVPLLPDIKVPTLIIVGEFDAFTPIPDAELMHNSIPNSQLVIIKEAGHLTNLEQPEAFDQALGRWAGQLQP
ncbi:MAG TPA: alpha/beta fold hydrolase [Acidobacteriaceae bacterium]|jgi:pimeloyl-ACP methyl ester carboxylesterase|nr:alpha/beta fold hydrolase [Acidobacteriaceae bacterium]